MLCRSCGGAIRSDNKTGYCSRTPECKTLGFREYTEQNRDKMRAHWRAYNQRNAVVVDNGECGNCGRPLRSDNRYGYCHRSVECRRGYMRNNPEVFRQSTRRRRAAKTTVPSENQVSRAILYDMLGGLCFICGDPLGESFDLDHIIPLSKGGWDGYGNLVPTHGARSDHFACNQGKWTRIDWDSPEVQVVLDEFIVNDGVELAYVMLRTETEVANV